MPIVDWTSLVERGYLHERGLVAPELVARARAEIDDDLRRNYDPAREEEYSSRTYCPTILDARRSRICSCARARTTSWMPH